MAGVRRYFVRQAWVAAAAAGVALLLASTTGVAAYALTEDARTADPEVPRVAAATRPPLVTPRATIPSHLESQPVSQLPRATAAPANELLVQSLEAEQALADSVAAEATPEPTPSPVPTVVRVGTAVAARVITPPRADLYELIAAAFPEDPEKAYRIALCESSGNPAVNTGNGYYGMWQFDVATWHSVGGAGLPSDASLEEQTMRARMLYDARGWQPWGCQ